MIILKIQLVLLPLFQIQLIIKFQGTTLHVMPLYFRCVQSLVNSSPPSATYMHQCIRLALVKIIACHLFGTKPLSKPMLCLLSIGPLGTNFSEILLKIQNFSFMKMHLKILSAKWQPFCPGGDKLTYWGLHILANILPKTFQMQILRIWLTLERSLKPYVMFRPVTNKPWSRIALKP